MERGGSVRGEKQRLHPTSKSAPLRSLACWCSDETAVAAAPSTVPADREAAFVCSTGNGIVWHRLECDIIVLGFFFFLL